MEQVPNIHDTKDTDENVVSRQESRVPVFRPLGSISPSPSKKPVKRMYILKPDEIIIYINYEDTQNDSPLIERMRPGSKYVISKKETKTYDVLKLLISFPDDVDDYIVKFNDIILDDLYKPIGYYIQDTKEAILTATERPRFQVTGCVLGSQTTYTLDVHEYTFFSDIRYDMLGDSMCYKFNMVYRDMVLDLEKQLIEYNIKSSAVFTFVPIMRTGQLVFKRPQQPVLINGPHSNISIPPNKTNNISGMTNKPNTVIISQMPGFATTPHINITQDEIDKHLSTSKLINRKTLTLTLAKHGFASAFIFESGSIYLLTKAQQDYFKSTMPIIFQPKDRQNTASTKKNLVAIVHALMDRYNMNTTTETDGVSGIISNPAEPVCDTEPEDVPRKTRIVDMLQKLKQSKAERLARLESANTKLLSAHDITMG